MSSPHVSVVVTVYIYLAQWLELGGQRLRADKYFTLILRSHHHFISHAHPDNVSIWSQNMEWIYPDFLMTDPCRDKAALQIESFVVRMFSQCRLETLASGLRSQDSAFV